MENIPDTAAESIREIERLAKASTEPKTVTINAPDGAGKSTPVPVAIIDGKLTDLTQFARAASAFAKESRLSFAPGPDFRAGAAQHQAFKSFVEHANRFKSPASAIWADPAQRRFVAVLDYHPEGADSKAAWQRHRGVYPAPLSEAWSAWGGEAGLELSQDEFADLLDARDRELATGDLPGAETPAPAPSLLITLAANLEVFANTSVKRSRDPNTGRVKLSFIEEKGVAGELFAPRAFLISIPIFRDSAPSLLEVRLRVQVEDNAAKFIVTIHAAGNVLAAAFDELCDDAAAKTGMPVFVGTPESA